MFVLGLTGSIGMGKSTAAEAFRRLGVPVHDADSVVHRLMSRGGKAVGEIEKQFPESIVDRTVDRQVLGRQVFGNDQALKALEDILHPLVREEEGRFLKKHAVMRAPMVVLDIPLLFEAGAEARCDAVAVVTAPPFIQRQRVLSRPGMTEERLDSILAKQMPDEEKRLRADFIIQTGQSRADALRCIKEIVRVIKGKKKAKETQTSGREDD